MSSPTSGRTPITVPLDRRIRAWRTRHLPVLIWLIAAITVIIIMQRQSRRIDAVGIVEVRETIVAPIYDGVIDSISADLFDTVEQGQPVVHMNDHIVAAELDIAQAELRQLRAQLDAERLRIETEGALQTTEELTDLRRFIMNEQVTRLDYLDRLVLNEADAIELQRLELLANRQQELVNEDIAGQSIADDLRLQAQIVRIRIQENRETIEIARQHVQLMTEARAQREQQTPLPLDLAPFLAPWQELVAAQVARIQEVAARRDALTLKAPLTGHVASKIYHPGETVLAGDPILTITQPAAHRVVAYIEERARSGLRIGTPVAIYSRGRPRKEVHAQILNIGAHIQRLPTRLWRNPLTPQRGLAILVGDIPGDAFLPGETVDITFIIGSN